MPRLDAASRNESWLRHVLRCASHRADIAAGTTLSLKVDANNVTHIEALVVDPTSISKLKKGVLYLGIGLVAENPGETPEGHGEEL